MKRMIAACFAALLMILVTASAEASTALATMRVSTRLGPGTQYEDMGTYPLDGKEVTVITTAYDQNLVEWVQIEIQGKSGHRRLYTGMKRFDKSSFPSLDNESDTVGYEAKVSRDTQAYYGPGSGYDRHKYKVTRGEVVQVVYTEGDYAMIDYTPKDTDQQTRCYVLLNDLRAL